MSSRAFNSPKFALIYHHLKIRGQEFLMSSPVKLAGLAGGSGHGKTTLGNMLGELAGKATTLEYSTYVIALANEWGIHWSAQSGYSMKRFHDIGDALTLVLNRLVSNNSGRKLTKALVKEAMAKSGGLSALERYLKKDKFPRNISMANRAEHRELLEFLGVFLVEFVAEDFWDLYLDPDLRIAVESHDFVSVSIRMPSNAALIREHGGAVVKVFNPRKEVKKNPTEAGLIDIRPDVIVVNDLGLPALRRTAKFLWGLLDNGLESNRADNPVVLYATDHA